MRDRWIAWQLHIVGQAVIAIVFAESMRGRIQPGLQATRPSEVHAGCTVLTRGTPAPMHVAAVGPVHVAAVAALHPVGELAVTRSLAAKMSTNPHMPMLNAAVTGDK